MNIDVKGAKISKGMVEFSTVLIDKDGFVVIHAVKDGKPVLPQSIGHTMIKAGASKNVMVKVDGGGKAGTDYVVMISLRHQQNGKYEFGEGITNVDTPGMKPDNTPYALPFKVSK